MNHTVFINFKNWKWRETLKKAKKFYFLLTVIILFIPVFILSSGCTVNRVKLVRDILAATGVKGGLVVHVGCGKGELTAQLRADKSFLVQGLDRDTADVRRAREYIHSLGIYGDVTIERWSGDYLPYIDNLVDLLVWESPEEPPMEEIIRVLSPEGIAYIKKNNGWVKEVKPWPEDIDVWTHYQYDCRNSAVSKDKHVGPPRHFQWLGNPKWSLSHENMSSLQAMVSDEGRLFYIIDEGPNASPLLPANWCIVARDAFNGVVLWKRSIDKWITRLWPYKSGPSIVPRTLVAEGGYVYAPLGINEPISRLNAASGEIDHTYLNTRSAEEVIFSEGMLLVVVNPNPRDLEEVEEERKERRNWNYDNAHLLKVNYGKTKRVVALDPTTGKTFWEREGPQVMPLTLAADGEDVLYHNGERIVCLNQGKGKVSWFSDSIPVPDIFPSALAPTLVIYKDVVLFAWDGKLTSFSKSNGEKLWETQWPKADYTSPVSVLVINDLLWRMNITSGRDSGKFTGFNPRTGKVEREFLPSERFSGMSHHRCHKVKATEKYVLTSRAGVEFVDIQEQKWEYNHWVRGSCLYGILPANGLLYATPDPCACFIKAKFNGLAALAPSPKNEVTGESPRSGNRLVKGSAYYSQLNKQVKREDWPTYRHDNSRSGKASTEVPEIVKLSFRAKIAENLTAPTIANGKIYVASMESHTLYAIDSEKGGVVWRCTVGGRIDSPPSIYMGKVYLGSADGCVYCFRASDGKLCWRYRAAPLDRMAVAKNQLESVWPLHGSVLVMDGSVYCAAGRSSFLDGGIRLLKIDATTGKLLSENTIYDLKDGRRPPADELYHVEGQTWISLPTNEMEGHLPDILSSDGENIFMRQACFNLKGETREKNVPHLYSPAGFLDNTWFHRIYWLYAKDNSAGCGGWWLEGNSTPSGRILILDEDYIYGFGRNYYPGYNSPVFSRREKYTLFAVPRSDERKVSEEFWSRAWKLNRERKYLLIDWSELEDVERNKWSKRLSFDVRAMVLAGKTLFIAGPAGNTVTDINAYKGKTGGRLAVVSAQSGEILWTWKLDAAPVFDGMAAADGCLYISMMDGTVRCYGFKGEALEKIEEEQINRIEENFLERGVLDKKN